jgi:hypothetical protein
MRLVGGGQWNIELSLNTRSADNAPQKFTAASPRKTIGDKNPAADLSTK